MSDYLYILRHQPHREHQHWAQAFSVLHGKISLFLPKKYPPRYLYCYKVQWMPHTSRLKPIDWETHHIHLLSGPTWLASYYLLEWTLTFLPEQQAHPSIFQLLAESLTALEHYQKKEDIESVLRTYERQTLNALGYGLSLEHIVDIEAPFIHYHPTQGYHGHAHDGPLCLPKSTLIAILSDDYSDPSVLNHSKKWFQMIVKMLLPHHNWKCKALYHKIYLPEAPGQD